MPGEHFYYNCSTETAKYMMSQGEYAFALIHLRDSYIDATDKFGENSPEVGYVLTLIVECEEKIGNG